MFDAALTEAARTLLVDFDHEMRRQRFYLAGDSGLTLQLGHRVSATLEFFTSQPFEPEVLSRYLKTKTRYKETLSRPSFLQCTLRKVKLSFQHNPAHLRHPLLEYQSVMVADWRDILADILKTLAEHRGSQKDFYDLYACFTLRNLDIPAGVAMLRRRYAHTDPDYQKIAENLASYQTAEAEPAVQLLKPLPWQIVKDFISKSLPKFERYLIAED